MRVQEIFVEQSSGFELLWKLQMAVGLLLLIFGALIVVFPQILAYLVAAAILATGLGLVGSAWRLRQLERRVRDAACIEVIE